MRHRGDGACDRPACKAGITGSGNFGLIRAHFLAGSRRDLPQLPAPASSPWSLSLCAKVASDVCYCEGAIFSAVTTERAGGSQTTQGVCDNALHTVRRSILTTVHAGADLLGRAEGLVQPIV